MVSPFDGARIKIARARTHLAELDREIEAYFRRDAAYVVLEQASEYNSAGFKTAAFTYRQREAVPTEWSAIVGDVLHNARTCLDLIASEIYRLTGGAQKDLSQVYYPFCRAQHELSETIKRRRLGHIGKDFIDIIKLTAPYIGGNDGLRAVHDLDIADKHKSLVPTLSVVAMDWPIPIVEGPQIFATGVQKDGQRLMLFPAAYAGSTPFGTRIKAQISLVFGDVGFFSGRDVSKQLEACLDSIEIIIGMFVQCAVGKGLFAE